MHQSVTVLNITTNIINKTKGTDRRSSSVDVGRKSKFEDEATCCSNEDNIFRHSLVQLVESMRDPLDHGDTKLLAQRRNIMISYASKWLWIFLEGQVRGAPLFEQFWQSIRRLSSYHEQPGVQFPQGAVEVLQTLQQESVDKLKLQTLCEVIFYYLLYFLI